MVLTPPSPSFAARSSAPSAAVVAATAARVDVASHAWEFGCCTEAGSANSYADTANLSTVQKSTSYN